MARCAADALRYVNAVIEVHVVGQIVYPNPANGAVGAKTLAYRLQHRGVIPDLRVAIHTGLGRRNIGKRRILDSGVAITAVNAQTPDMMFVTEWNRLFDRNSCARRVRGLVQFRPRPNEERNDKQAAEDTQAGKCVRAVVKNLGHLTTSRGFPHHSKTSHLNMRKNMHRESATELYYLTFSTRANNMR